MPYGEAMLPGWGQSSGSTLARNHVPRRAPPRGARRGYCPGSSAYTHGELNTSRTFRIKVSGVNGFWRKATPLSSTPCRTMLSSV